MSFWIPVDEGFKKKLTIMYRVTSFYIPALFIWFFYVKKIYNFKKKV